ncbi:hypothetical protein [Pseudoalteromonas obscura]|uniref:Uncharacterized protein n=1 Tax=Pseudoalteromonas obscura TaxID=3048491 RepID=A0ABT7EE86_9GAMM|nr:hypothetical protein [Pseudoalteromonas sp. P94(2023)]MDK2593591.1 hypothetical protein [Pseudoalteromonas sp. P94(2023)]
MNDKVTKWLIFGAGLALVPLLAVWICRLIFGQDSSLVNLLSQGELLLITAGLCAAGIGELIGSGEDYKIAKIISGGISVGMLLVSALIFSIVSNPAILNTPPNVDVISTASIIIYCCAFLSSGTCAYLAE